MRPGAPVAARGRRRELTTAGAARGRAVAGATFIAALVYLLFFALPMRMGGRSVFLSIPPAFRIGAAVGIGIFLGCGGRGSRPEHGRSRARLPPGAASYRWERSPAWAGCLWLAGRTRLTCSAGRCAVAQRGPHSRSARSVLPVGRRLHGAGSAASAAGQQVQAWRWHSGAVL